MQWIAARVRMIFHHRIIIATVALSVLSVITYLPCRIGRLELLTHFEPYYLAGLLLLLPLFIQRSSWAGAVIVASIFAIAIAPYVDYFFPHECSANAGGLRILQINIWPVKNKHYDKAEKLVKETAPDIISVSELTRDWLEELKTRLGKDYPYVAAEPKYGGVAIFSKVPLKNVRVHYTAPFLRPRILADINIQGEDVTFISVHTTEPTKRLRDRNIDLQSIAADVNSAEHPVIVSGDLNCTPWSPYFRKFVKATGLRDSSKGFGFQPTWPSKSSHRYLPMSVITIDHVLTSRELCATGRRTTGTIGSDHLPIVVNVALHHTDQRDTARIY